MPLQDACRLFGFDIPTGKRSVPKRIKRDVARGRTSLFGELVETLELNQWDHRERYVEHRGYSAVGTVGFC